ncbi:peptidoglycan DD-metalloendopeptidase family protein [Propionivibrio limicola]|uniref:peptidoglycan DD-metalloendopeptidase family protein n=1 Tax=Propionivibrio limicola TaxID=167645 RepID=UPI001291FDBA|nr:peptidoglycan DD-metalloendopeptidase family protein [Propionivibrio limicola]
MKNFYALTKPRTIGLALAVMLAMVGCASKTPAPVQGRAGQVSSAAGAGKDAYVVKKGDTLYSIAREHGMDFRELVALNRIENPNVISEGLVLKVKPLASTSAVASTAPVRVDEVVVRPIDGVPLADQANGGSEMLKREPKAGKVPYSEQALAQAQSEAQAKSVEQKPAEPKAAESASAVKPETKPAEAVSPGEVAWIWPANGKVVATFSDGGNKGVDISGRAGDAVIAAGDGKVVYSGAGLRGYGKLVIIKHNATYLSAYAHNQTLLVREGQSVVKGQRIAEMGNSDADQVKLHFEVRRQGKPVDPLKYLPQR